MTRLSAVMLVVACGCGADDSPPPLFPADYATTYTEVRNCRPSIEHGDVNIRVLADPTALAPYQNRTDPFPDGAILLKEEYSNSDPTCSQQIRAWTVMKKVPDGTETTLLDWHWQKVDLHRTTIENDTQRCVSCHKMCNDQGGYMNTCTLP